MKIARVFPRRTKATPDDPLAFTGPPPRGGLPDIEEVHVSVAFTYDMEKACQLAEQWMKLGVPVHMGGPAFNMPGGNFVPGMYLKKGYVTRRFLHCQRNNTSVCTLTIFSALH